MNIKELDKKRIEFIHEIYNTAGGKGPSGIGVSMNDIGEKLNLTPELLNDVVGFLVENYLIEETGSGWRMRLTSESRQEVEEMLRNPKEKTEHFKPLNIINNIYTGNITNSNINNFSQQATNNSNQTITETKFAINKIEEILNRLEKQLDVLTLEEKENNQDEFDIIKSEAETIKTQLSSSEPKINIINSSFSKISSLAKYTTKLATIIKPVIDTINEYRKSISD